MPAFVRRLYVFRTMPLHLYIPSYLESDLRCNLCDALQLKASTDFLRQAHPLKHVAPVRKSQVQHAVCEVLAAMLADNVKADLPRCPPVSYSASL